MAPPPAASRQDARRLPDLVVLVVGLTLADRDQLVHRIEIVDVELPGEVIELVLERASEQAGAGDLDLLADPVLGDDPDLLLAGDVGDVAGDREAALEVPVLPVRADDPRVDQLVELAIDLDDTDLQSLSELRRGKPDSRGVTHRVGQVVDQLVEVFPEAVDGLTL